VAGGFQIQNKAIKSLPLRVLPLEKGELGDKCVSPKYIKVMIKY